MTRKCRPPELLAISFLITSALLSGPAHAKCTSTRTILFTAFEGYPMGKALIKDPSGKWVAPEKMAQPEDNNAYKTVSLLKQRYERDSRLFGACVKAVFCLPIPMEQVRSVQVVEECIKAAKPDDVYMLGQGYCKSINYETASVNKLHFEASDNAGFMPDPNPGKVDPTSENNVVPESLPLAELACGVSGEDPFEQRVATTFGITKGNFDVCNSLSYQIGVSRRAEIEKSIGKTFRSGFIHVPQQGCPKSNPADYSFALSKHMNELYSHWDTPLKKRERETACVADKAKEILDKNAAYALLIKSEPGVCLGVNGQPPNRPEAVVDSLKNLGPGIDTVKKAYLNQH